MVTITVTRSSLDDCEVPPVPGARRVATPSGVPDWKIEVTDFFAFILEHGPCYVEIREHGPWVELRDGV
jgi:hypothetical protein